MALTTGSTESMTLLIKAKDLYSGELNKMEKKFRVSAVAIAGALAGVTVALRNMAEETAVVAEEAHKWSIITGVNIQELTRLQFVVGRLGGNTEHLHDILKETNVKMKEASEGTGGLFDNLGHLGIKVTDIDGQLRDTGVVFEEIVSSLADMENAALRTAIADEIWSDAGTELLPILIKNKDAVEALKRDSDRLNHTLSDESVKAAVDYKNSMREMDANLKAISLTIGKEVIPILASSARWWSRLFENMQKSKEETQKFVSSRSIEEVTKELDKQVTAIKDLNKAYEETRVTNIIQKGYLALSIKNRRKMVSALNEERAAIIKLNKEREKEVEQVDPKTGKKITGFTEEQDRLAIELANKEFAREQQKIDHYVSLSEDYQSAQDRRNQIDEARLARQDEMENSREKLLIDAANKEVNREFEKYETLARMSEDHFSKEEQRRERDNKAAEQAALFKKQLNKDALSNSVSFFESLNTLADGKNREAFEALKIARAAETIVNTYAGATRALTLPYPYNIIAMAAVITAGLANLAVIQRTTFGSGAGGGATAPTVTPIPTTIPTDTAATTTETAQVQNITIEINNPLGTEDWNQIAEDEIIPAINTALDRNAATLNV